MGARWRVCAVVVATALSGACAARSSPSTLPPTFPEGGGIPTQTSFDLVPLKTGSQHLCAKDNGPYLLFGRAGQTVTWRVTNNCGTSARVILHKFRMKHKTFGSGPHPAGKDPGVLELGPGETKDLTLTIRESRSVESEDRGFNVFKYQIDIVTDDGKNANDPEIIIEWP